MFDYCDQFVQQIFGGIDVDGSRKFKCKLWQVGVTPSSTATTALLILILSPIYGLVMGSYAGVSGQREIALQFEQMFYSAIKMPVLLIATTMLSLPSFFVFNTIAGLRRDFHLALKAIWASMSSFVILLAALMPLTLFFYFCINANPRSYRAAVLFNALIFAMAASGSQVVVYRSYRKLIQASYRHFYLLVSWCFVFAFVGIQLGWTLRPFIGSPNKDTTFFRDEPFSNAYIEVLEILRSALLEF